MIDLPFVRSDRQPRLPECDKCGARLDAIHRVGCPLVEGEVHPNRVVTRQHVRRWFF